MALVAYEDFESPMRDIVDQTLITKVGSPIHSTSYGENGELGVRCYQGQRLDVTLPNSHATLIASARCRFTGQNSGGYFLLCSDDTTTNSLQLRQYNGQIRVIGGGVDEWSVGPLLDSERWYTFEMKLTLTALTIRIDGQQIYNNTGLSFGSAAHWTEWKWGHNSPSGVDMQSYVTRLAVADGSGSYNTDWLHDPYCEYLLPDGDGNQTDWTPDTGTTNYTQVDEDPKVDTDYVQAGTEADIDLYTYPAVASATDGIIAVSPSPYLLLPDGGSRYIRPVTRVSSTDYTPLGSLAVVDADGMGRHFFEENPNASAAWTPTTVNAAEFGYEVRDT